tara:strand:+ start:244 stop:765 length:522 start_codon:yes stop_codon:yes gene_type:complete
MEVRKVLIISLLVFVFISNTIQACKCKTVNSYEKLVEISYTSSDFVFLGELIRLDTLTGEYTFQVLESFKGNNKIDTIIYKPQTSCSLYISENGKWIIYGDIINEVYIDISQCGASRSENKPTCSNCPNCIKMVPDPRLSKSEMEDHKIKVEGLKVEALARWHNELIMLRKQN